MVDRTFLLTLLQANMAFSRDSNRVQPSRTPLKSPPPRSKTPFHLSAGDPVLSSSIYHYAQSSTDFSGSVWSKFTYGIFVSQARRDTCNSTVVYGLSVKLTLSEPWQQHFKDLFCIMVQATKIQTTSRVTCSFQIFEALQTFHSKSLPTIRPRKTILPHNG